MNNGLSEKRTPPFFVVGAQRSGTTLLRLMLNAHPDLCVPYETNFLYFLDRLDTYGPLALKANREVLLKDMAAYSFIRKGKLIDDVDRIAKLPCNSFADLIDNVFSSYAAARGKAVWGDKTPSFVTEIDNLWGLFPGCKIIHIVRDGRDVALSLSGVEWGSSHIPHVAEDWKWKTLIGHKTGRVLQDNYLFVRYEDLILDTHSILGRICQFLGIPFDVAMERHYEDAEENMPAEAIKWHGSSVEPPDPDKVYQWKDRMRPSDRIIFDSIAGGALETFGYEMHAGPATFMSKYRGLYYSVVKRW